MRITALTGAASAALGAVVVAGAGPALAATTLTQGSAIATPSGACSLTLAGEGTAYTAAHCGAGQWRIGSPVRTADGELAGTVSGLPGDSGVDLVKVALADDVEVVGDWSTRDAASVENGETVYTHGSSAVLGSPNSLSRPGAAAGAGLCAPTPGQAALDAATTRAADAGGAVYDVRQRVIGVVTGTAPVSFDADGGSVPCATGSLSSVMVPAESFSAANATTVTKTPRPAPKHALPAQAAPAAQESAAAPAKAARPAPKHALTAEAPHAPIGVDAEDLPTAGTSPVPDSQVKTPHGGAQEGLADEMIARAEAHRQGAPGAAAASTPAASHVSTATASPAKGVRYGTRVVARSASHGFDAVTVTAYDAQGRVLGQNGLKLSGEIVAWLPVPAAVPAGGKVVVSVSGAHGVDADPTVTLGGAPIR